MGDKQPPGLPDDEATKFESDFKKAMAEMERVKERLAIEQPEVGSSANSATIRRGDTERVNTREASRGSTVTESEKPTELLDVLNRILGEISRSATTTRRQLLYAIVAVIVAILGLIATVVFGITSNNRSAERAENKIEASRFFDIIVPKDRADVGLGQKVLGNTPFLHMNHYVIVTLVRTGAAYVQAQPAVVNADGTFSGEVRLGDIPVIDDDELKIQILATKTIMAAGALIQIPDDAIFSTLVIAHSVQSSPVVGGQIVITAPTNGAEVDPAGTISGKTPFPDLNHYIVVTPLRVGTAFVQDQTASINRADSTFTGRARFGGAQVGIGEQFMVRVLATKSTLPAAPLTNEPADAVYSNSVTVTRKR